MLKVTEPENSKSKFYCFNFQGKYYPVFLEAKDFSEFLAKAQKILWPDMKKDNPFFQRQFSEIEEYEKKYSVFEHPIKPLNFRQTGKYVLAGISHVYHSISQSRVTKTHLFITDDEGFVNAVNLEPCRR